MRSSAMCVIVASMATSWAGFGAIASARSPVIAAASVPGNVVEPSAPGAADTASQDSLGNGATAGPTGIAPAAAPISVDRVSAATPTSLHGAPTPPTGNDVAAPVADPKSSPRTVPPTDATTWSAYGGDGRGQRHAMSKQITRANVGRLALAWDFRTGELGAGFARAGDALTFEATPLAIDGMLYVSTATGVVFAIDAATGTQKWRFDAAVDRRRDYSEMSSRGVAFWRSASGDAGAACAERILFGTIDARLLAIDARSGRRCADFDDNGERSLAAGVRVQHPLGSYQFTSPPAIAGDVAIVGSSVGDNRGRDIEIGVVRAFDVRSGRELWHWDPIPRAATIPPGSTDPNFGEVGEQVAHWTGAANAWAPFAVDAERGLVFVPTGSASPDFFGGMRPGDDQWADSIVALRAATGELVWGRQLVHHDLWDYDTASQPMLIDLERDGATRAAVVQLNKTGQVFVFDRESGEPLFPIEERPVPQDAVAGETPSPTQPFSSLPSLVPTQAVTPDDAWGFTFSDRGACHDKIASLKSEGIYTPPSLAGTIERPGYAGGPNWGGGAWDPERHLLVVNVMDVPMVVALIPRADYEGGYDFGAYDGWEFARQAGTPYAMRRHLLDSSFGAPCTAPPWGKLVAVDLSRGAIAWETPLGTSRDKAPWPLWWIEGAPNLGGPLTTAGGLVFIGATTDNFLRAFDVATGEEVWKARLPAGAQATPMSVEVGGRQFIVVAAGGHAKLGTTRGDHVMAFALPE